MVTTEAGLFQCCHFVWGKAHNAQSKIRRLSSIYVCRQPRLKDKNSPGKFLSLERSSCLNVETEPRIKWWGEGDPCINVKCRMAITPECYQTSHLCVVLHFLILLFCVPITQTMFYPFLQMIFFVNSTVLAKLRSSKSLWFWLV